MLDKIRLHAKGELPSDYHANLGTGFDEKCVKFLLVDYKRLVERVKQGGTDEEISCGSAAGTTKFRKWWFAGKPRQE